jgi:prepilin-type N-terminal cleavage/methylation domain-containing protein
MMEAWLKFIAIKRSRGFTLIELLVVISIIGVLSSVVLSTTNNSVKKSRDAKRLSDMETLRLAIEMYADDHSGAYFSTGGSLVCLGVPSTEQCWGGPSGNDALNAALAPYLAKIPKDPLYGSRIYGAYVYRSPGSYWLPAPINAVGGSYSIAFEPEKLCPANNNNDCSNWTWASWDNPPGGIHCPAGGCCRHCGFLRQ